MSNTFFVRIGFRCPEIDHFRNAAVGVNESGTVNAKLSENIDIYHIGVIPVDPEGYPSGFQPIVPSGRELAISNTKQDRRPSQN